MKQVPVFLVTGFLEGGKTTFVKEIFNDPDFADGDKVVLIACEEGIEEYEEKFLKDNNITLYPISEKEEFNYDFFAKCEEECNPDKVIVEYNGTWAFSVIENAGYPENWHIVQIMTPIDSTTFSVYMGNGDMKSLMIEQFKESELIVFNRCNDNTDKLSFRNAVKAINPRANIIFELENGVIDDRPLALPFDINADIIEFKDYDFGAWYMDIMEEPKKYKGKKIKIRGMVYTNKHYPRNMFAVGRNAMTCCADDISFLGVLCKYEKPFNFIGETWIEIEGTLGVQFIPQEQRDIPFLSASGFKTIEKPEDELVYF